MSAQPPTRSLASAKGPSTTVHSPSFTLIRMPRMSRASNDLVGEDVEGNRDELLQVGTARRATGFSFDPRRQGELGSGVQTLGPLNRQYNVDEGPSSTYSCPMTFPVPLDNLIGYVKTLHPDGGPLANLSDAVTVADRLDEQSDALIGHFVDQARSSGSSWSQIGASMGVSKQAAQKRFVARDDSDLAPEGKEFSRFTSRARNVLAAAGQIATSAGADAVDVDHLAAGLLAEPEGLAAKIIHRLGVTDEQVYIALGVGPAAGNYDTDLGAFRELHFTDAIRAALRETLKAALRLGHNYIGTEHLLLGLATESEAAGAFGLSRELIERALAVEIAQVQLDRQRQAG